MAAAAQIKRLRLGGVRLQLSSQFRQLKSASSKLVLTNRGKKKINKEMSKSLKKGYFEDRMII